MTVRRLLKIIPVTVIAILAVWIGLYPQDWQNWLGFSHAAYFTTGQNYALYSGFLPVLITSLGLSTIVTGLWHGLNCHEPGCWRIGKHKVNGTPWCSVHQADARPQATAEEILEAIRDQLAELNAFLRNSK
ncbi:MAG: hypothetical protein ACYCOU_14765 [Sulfobacillus sp.]